MVDEGCDDWLWFVWLVDEVGFCGFVEQRKVNCLRELQEVRGEWTTSHYIGGCEDGLYLFVVGDPKPRVIHFVWFGSLLGHDCNIGCGVVSTLVSIWLYAHEHAMFDWLVICLGLINWFELSIWL